MPGTIELERIAIEEMEEINRRVEKDTRRQWNRIREGKEPEHLGFCGSIFYIEDERVRRLRK
jgi:hypothetical protein